MLKKGHPIKFSRPSSLMDRVFKAVQDGHTSKMRIVVATSLPFQRVTTALYALTFSGNLVMTKEGRTSRYSLPNEQKESKITTECINELQRIFYAGTTQEDYSASKNRQAEID